MYSNAFQPQFQPTGRGVSALGVAAALGMGASGRGRGTARMAAWVPSVVQRAPLAHEVPSLRQVALADRAVPSAAALDAMSPDERARLLGEW